MERYLTYATDETINFMDYYEEVKKYAEVDEEGKQPIELHEIKGAAENQIKLAEAYLANPEDSANIADAKSKTPGVADETLEEFAALLIRDGDLLYVATETYEYLIGTDNAPTEVFDFLTHARLRERTERIRLRDWYQQHYGQVIVNQSASSPTVLPKDTTPIELPRVNKDIHADIEFDGWDESKEQVKESKTINKKEKR